MILTVGEDKSFKTIGAAVAAAADGDTVIVGGGVYRENVTVNKALAVVAAEGETPVIDGGWDGKTTGGGFGGQLSATAAGAVLDGLTVRNAPGRGIGVGASNVTVRNCTVMDCYKGGFGANPAAGQTYTGLLIENNLIMRVGLERFTSGGTVNGSFLFTDVVDSVFVGNIIANGMGEGINIDRNSRGNVIEHNLVINCAHVGIYINCAQDNIVRSNTVIWSGAAKPVSGKKETAPAGIIIGDEGPASKKFSPSRGNVIANNLVVGSGKLFQVRNNAHNYNTQLDAATRIERNTFVAGPQTERGIDIAANQRGRPHEAAVIADNVIDWAAAPAGAVIAARADAALDFRGNVWGATPTQDVRGPGDAVAAGPLLVNPTAGLHPEWDMVDVGFQADNYRPIAGGAADGKGALTAMEPDTPEPPEPPEPPAEPDYASIIESLERHLERLEDASVALVGVELAVDEAVVETYELIDRLRTAAGYVGKESK